MSFANYIDGQPLRTKCFQIQKPLLRTKSRYNHATTCGLSHDLSMTLKGTTVRQFTSWVHFHIQRYVSSSDVNYPYSLTRVHLHTVVLEFENQQRSKTIFR